MPIEVGDIVRIKETSSFPGGWVGVIGVVDYVYNGWSYINIRVLLFDSYIHTIVCIPLKSVEKL